jgi:hypothetical protein
MLPQSKPIKSKKLLVPPLKNKIDTSKPSSASTKDGPGAVIGNFPKYEATPLIKGSLL